MTAIPLPPEAERVGLKGRRFRPDSDTGRANGAAGRDDRVDSRALPFEAFDDIVVDVRKPWIIKGLFARRETSAIIGAPGSGKSALITDMVVHATAGWDWRGRRTKEQCAAIILAFERVDLLKRRLEVYRRKHGLGSLPIAIIKTPVDLMQPGSVSILTATIRKVEQQFNLPVGIVVIDTYAKAIAYGGGDENAAKDQNRALGHLREVQNQTDVHVSLIGHTGKDETRGQRGSNANLGDVDLEITISGGHVKTARITKANDQPEGVLTTYCLETFDFGVDEDGDPITTSILSADTPDIPGQKTCPGMLTPAEHVAMRMLQSAIVEAGQRPPASNHIPGQIRNVTTIEMWRGYCYQGGISAGDTTQTARQKAFKRAISTLQKKNLVGVWEPYVWLASDAPAQPDTDI